MSTTAIPKGSVVLVTGVNGYLGLHVADQLVSQGYNVLGTVRDEAKATWTKEYFEKTYGAGKFNVAIVKDLGSEGSFDDLMNGTYFHFYWTSRQLTSCRGFGSGARRLRYNFRPRSK